MDNTNLLILVQAIFDVAILITLIFASISDVKTRLVKPSYQYAFLALSVAHLITLFIFNQTAEAIDCLLAGAGLFTIYIVMVLIFKAGIGGADTKMSSMLALYLGLKQGVAMVLIHGIVGFLYAKIRGKATNTKIETVPLMPFLLVGYVGAKIIYYITTYVV